MVDMSKGKAAFLHFLPFCHIDFAKVHIYFEITLTKMCKKAKTGDNHYRKGLRNKKSEEFFTLHSTYNIS